MSALRRMSSLVWRQIGARPVLELVLDTIEQVTEVAAGIVLLCRCEEHSSLQLPALHSNIGYSVVVVVD